MRNSVKFLSTTEIEKSYVGQINYLLSILYRSIIICLKSIILYLSRNFFKSFPHTLTTIFHILPTVDHKIPYSQFFSNHFVFLSSDVVHERSIVIHVAPKSGNFLTKSSWWVWCLTYIVPSENSNHFTRRGIIRNGR